MTKFAKENIREDSLIRQARQEGLPIPRGVDNGKWDKNDERLLQSLLRKDRQDGRQTIYRAQDGTIKDSSARDDGRAVKNQTTKNNDLTEGDIKTAQNALNKWHLKHGRDPSDYDFRYAKKTADGSVVIFYTDKNTGEKYGSSVVNGRVR